MIEMQSNITQPINEYDGLLGRFMCKTFDVCKEKYCKLNKLHVELIQWKYFAFGKKKHLRENG